MCLCRWHGLGAYERTGVDLELLPMLLGFFTYKAGVVAKQFVDLVGAATRGPQADKLVAGMVAIRQLFTLRASSACTWLE